jgi:hypothetical protein
MDAVRLLSFPMISGAAAAIAAQSGGQKAATTKKL